MGCKIERRDTTGRIFTRQSDSAPWVPRKLNPATSMIIAGMNCLMTVHSPVRSLQVIHVLIIYIRDELIHKE